LVFTAAAIVTDAQLANVSGVEAIQASSLAGNSIILGANAQAGGVRSLFGGASSDILSAAGMTSGNIWIQGNSALSTQGDTLVAGTGTSRATLVGNNSANAKNYFQISTADLLGNNSIVGGASSTDYLQITTNGQVLSDASFAKVSGLDGLILTGGANTITLGATAQAKFGGTVSLTGGANGGDTINLSATTKKVYLDASAGINGDTITAGTNDNTLIGGSAASANDLFIFTSRSNLNGASVVGGGGTDTLRFAANFQTVANTDLDKLSSIEVFDLAGAGNSITLGNISSGIATIVGGTGPNTIDASGYTSAPNVLTWDISRSAGRDSLVGGESGNLFQVKIPGYLEISQIAGTVGNDDTIQILTGGQVIGETAFANISSIEKLVLGTATKGNRLTLGATAAAKGIATVVGGGSKDTIDASAFTADIRIDASAGTGARLIGSSSNNNTLIGGSAGGNEFVLGSLGTNVVFGGSNGLDTLTFTNTTTAADFSNLSKVAVLKFNSANNDIALGSDALIAGILTLVGGQGSDTGSRFDASTYGSVGLMFNITGQNYLKNSTLIGSAGMDTVKFSRDGVSVTDEVLANLYNIDVLQTANGNNIFLISDQFVAAGIDSIIGGLGKDTFDMSDNGIYTPSSVSDVPGASSDVIAFDASAGAGYTLIASTQSLSYAKVFGGASGGEVIVDGNSLDDSAFANMFAANAKKLTMRTASGVAVTLGGNAQFSGLTTLNLGAGDDQLDVTDFGGPLVVAGGGGGDLVKTSFSAFSDLTFNGSADSTLQVVDSDARAITSLKGSFGALALNAGNNFVSLGNDAGLSTIYGGSGYDTFSMLQNTTGVHFVIDPNKLGSVSGFNSLNGGSGSDTLSFSTNPTGNTFSDSQFLRIGLKNLNAGSGGEIENLVTYADPITGKGGAVYTLGQFSDNAGIDTVFFHQDDTVDAEDRAAVSSKSVNFIFTDPNALGTSQITGSDHAGSNDTLTARVVNAGNFTIRDVDFLNIRLVENFYFDTTNANGALDFEYGPNAYKSSNGIEKLVGNIGADTLRLDCLMVADTPFVFEGGDGTDTVVLINGLFSSVPTDPIEIKDGKFAGWKSVEQLFIDWTSPDYNRDTGGNDTEYNLTLGKNASDAGITKITGDKGNDTLNASAYLIAATIIGGEGDDSILSGTGVDSLDGGKGNDSLFSGAGNDSLIGGEGNDWLQGTSATSGGAGEIDTLTGGEGNDTFVLGDNIRAYYDTPALASDYALIMDFTAGDKLQLKNFGGVGNGYIIQTIVANSSYSLYRDSNSSGLLESATDNLIASITTKSNYALRSDDFNLVGLIPAV
jgi:Ca2+-binding RTX toxin-like protein